MYVSEMQCLWWHTTFCDWNTCVTVDILEYGYWRHDDIPYGLDAPALVVLGMRPVARANSFSGFHATADLQPSETTASTIAF